MCALENLGIIMCEENGNHISVDLVHLLCIYFYGAVGDIQCFRRRMCGGYEELVLLSFHTRPTSSYFQHHPKQFHST